MNMSYDEYDLNNKERRMFVVILCFEILQQCFETKKAIHKIQRKATDTKTLYFYILYHKCI